MDVLKINSTKIKIMMSPSDVKKFGLNTSDIDYNDKETRVKVWEILDFVKSNHDFDHGKDKLLVQFYPSKDGGAELFVTRLVGLSKGKERWVSKAGNVTMLDSRQTVYNFKNFNDLIHIAKIINGRKSIKGSELFYDDYDGYYLEITEQGKTRLDSICDLAIIMEFAEATPKDKLPYITEHCKKLTDGSAVEQLAKL
ncbi:MAG: adaptor protein MecA [Clostridia bacterium]|nr:adaptor protein MecA [Clostridia bacterium]